MKLTNDAIKDAVVKSGFVTEDDLKQAEKIAHDQNRSLMDIVIERGILVEKFLGQILAETLGYPYIDLRNKIIPDEILNLLDEKFASDRRVLVFDKHEKTLSLAMENPDDIETVELVKKKTGLLTEVYFCLPQVLDEGLDQYRKDIQLDFEKAISDYAKKYCVRFEVVKNNMSFKYPWEILSLKNYLLRNIRTDISKKAKISKSAEILGEVVIEEGVQIMENAVIKGPCFIGKNCFVGNNSVLRDGVDLEEGTVVGANMEVKNTLIMDYSKTHSGFLGDSIIGKNCRIGAGFCSANVRLNRDSIKVKLGEEKIDTRAKSMGVIVGDGARIGMQSSSMPGIIIGRNVVVGPKTTVMNNIEDNTKYYTKFQEVIIKKN